VSGTHLGTGTTKYPEPLCLRPVLPALREIGYVSSKGITPSSSLIQAHAPILCPPAAYGQSLGQRVFAGCHQPLLDIAPSQRYLRESFSRCLDPYPGGPYGALTRFFPQDIGLPQNLSGSALHNSPDNDFSPGFDFEAAVIHSCSGLWVCSPPRSFPPQRILPVQQRIAALGFGGLTRRFRSGPQSDSRGTDPPLSHALGSRGFYVHAYLGPLPRRAVDMLAVRIEQLTAEGLSPSKIRGSAGRS